MRYLITAFWIAVAGWAIYSLPPEPACASGLCGSLSCIDDKFCFDGCVCVKSGGGLGRCVERQGF